MKICLFVIVVSAGFDLFSQETDESTRVIQIYDWSLNPGVSYDYGVRRTTEDFAVLAPQAGLTDIVYPADYPPSYWHSAVYLNPAFNASVGGRFYSKEKQAYCKIPSIRLGLGYNRITPFGGRIYYSNETTVDTLVSTETGQTYYLDSVVSESYWMYYNAHVMKVDFSFLLRFNSEGRWSFYTGAGLSAGVSFSATTSIDHNTYAETKFRIGDESNYVVGLFESDDRKYKNKTGFNASCYLPVGLDLRLGKESAFWKRAHLFYEMRIGVNFVFIPELRMIRSTNFQQGLGFRFVL